MHCCWEGLASRSNPHVPAYHLSGPSVLLSTTSDALGFPATAHHSIQAKRLSSLGCLWSLGDFPKTGFYFRWNPIYQIAFFFFSFLWIVLLWYTSRNLCLIQGHKDFSLMLSSRSFMSLGFIQRSVIYFALFLYKMNKGPDSFLWIWRSNCPNAMGWKDNLIFRQFSLNFCQKSIDCVSVLLFLNYLFSSIDLCLFVNNTLSWLCGFVVILQILHLCSFSNLFLALPVPCISTKILEPICQFLFLKKSYKGFDGDCVEYTCQLEKNWYLKAFGNLVNIPFLALAPSHSPWKAQWKRKIQKNN